MTSAPGDHLPDPRDRQIDTLQKALRQTHWNLAIVSLMLAALIGAAGYAYFFGGRWVEAEKGKFFDAAKEQLADHSDDIAAEAGDLAADSMPPVSRAFAAQIEEDLPEYLQALDQQGDRLAKDLEAALKRKVARHYHRSLARYRVILREEFPDVDDPEMLEHMLTQVEKALDKLAEHYYVDELRRQTALTTRLWNSIPPLERRQIGDRALVERLMAHVVKWLRLRASEGAPAVHDSRETRP